MSDSSQLDELDRRLAAAPRQQSSPKGTMVFLLKIFIGVFLLILVAIGILFVIGGSEMEFQVEVEITAPPEKIYPLITEADSVKQWISGVADVRAVDPDAKFGVGYLSEIVVKQGDSDFIIRNEAIAVRPGHSVEFSLTSNMFNVSNSFLLESTESSDQKASLENTNIEKENGKKQETTAKKESDGKNGIGESQSPMTTVTQTYKIRFKGTARILAPFAKSTVLSHLKRDLQRLKKLGEGNNPDG